MRNNYPVLLGLFTSGKKTQNENPPTHSRTSSSFKSLLVIAFLFLLIPKEIYGQNITNYNFSYSNSGSLEDISTGSSALLTGNQDDVATTVQSIGFDFYYMGVKYTHFSANSNGQFRLHTSSGAVAIGGGNVTSYSNGVNTFAPMAGDNEVNNGINMKVVGTAPNRKLVIEWNQFYVNFANITNGGNMQSWLNETSGRIDYVYGAIYNSTTSSQTRSIFISAGNTATTAGHILIGAIPTFTAAAAPVTNTIAASTVTTGVASPLIANLGSSADGSRWIYSFTPSSIVTPSNPTTLTFTAITGTTITPNWVDNSIDETLFVVTRATDAAFTQNVATTIVNSTSTATTGTAYNSAQTGLTPGTIYYFKIQSGVEAGVPSTGITGSETTTMGTAYYWVGATGGNWNTAANWNTLADGSGSIRSTVDVSDVLIVDGAGTIAGDATTIIVDLASFSIGQFKVTNNTACTLESSITTTRTITLVGGPGDDFVIESGSNLLLNNATKFIAFAFSGSGNTGLISGTYTAAGGTSNNITTTGGTGTIFTIAPTGVVNNGIVGSSGCLTGSIATLVFADGSNYTHSNYTTSNAYIPTATWGASANATLTGGTTGTALTSGSTSLGNLTVNSTTLTATLSAFTSNVRTIQGNLLILNTNTGKFRAVTSGNLTINGNLTVSGGYLDIASSTGSVIVNGVTTVNPGATLDINSGILQQSGTTFTNNGTLTGTVSTARLNFFSVTNTPQTLSGTGTVLTNIGGLGISNTGGLTISHTNPIPTLRVNLFAGTITNSNKLTLGTGAALAAITQIGSTGLTTQGGFFDQSPVWNLGTGTYTLFYQEESVARTSGFEVPPTRTITNMSVANPNGLTIAGGNLEVGTTLTMTSGLINTSNANLLTLGTATTAGTLSGTPSVTNMIVGPFARTIATANANTNYILFPVGKTTYAPIWLAPATTAVSNMKAETFDTNAGTTDASLINLSATRRWEAPLVSGTLTDINVRVGDAGVVSTSIPVQAPAAAGVYTNAFGSVATYAAGTPPTVQSNTVVTAANYAGFLAYAESNSCSGTPAPGNTIASVNNICLGTSITLSLQNTTSGSGVTYAWESSADGILFTPISGAINPTFVTTPTAVTWYRCVVTCSTGPASATSTAVQVTFVNQVTGTTPGSVCGQGTVILAAAGNSGTIIKWFDAVVSGNLVGTGSPFTTPSLTATTSYYAAAETSSAGISTLGLGATNSTTVGQSFFPGSWGGTKTQYIIKASELYAAGLTAGPLTSLGFEPTTSGQTYQGFFVNLGLTTNLTAPSATFIGTGLSQVYAGTEANDGYTPIANNVNTLVFGTGTGSTPTFVWDGTSNIVVSISWSSVPSASTATASSMKVDNVGFVSAAYRQRDSVTPAAMLAETSVSSTSSFRPKFLINGQLVCSSPRVEVQATVSPAPTFTLSGNPSAICEGQSSSVVTITAGSSDYDTYVWSPATGVSGNASTGWTFNPASTTTYTLSVSQSSGLLCTNTATVTVTVNPLPSVMTISPSTANVCIGSIQSLSVTGGAISSAGSAVIGTATTLTAPTSQPTAFCNRFDHYWSQMVFTAAELTASGMQAGNINAIKFNITSLGSATNVSDFKVYMGNTASTTLSGFTTSGLTQVFSAATYSHNVGVNTIAFNTPFIWDGTSNVIVDIRQTGIDSANNAETYYTATPDIKTVYAITSTALASSDAFVATNPTATTSFNRLNTTFDWSVSVPQPITWTPVIDLYSDAAATIAYIAGANASTVYFKSNTAGGPTTYTATSTSANSCTRTATVDVTVNNTPAPTGAAAQTFVTGQMVSDIVVSGTATGTIIWYASATDAAAATNPLPATTVLVNNTTYYATQTDSGCVSTTSLAVTVTVNLGVDSFDSNSFSYYPNPVNDILNLSYSQEITDVKVFNVIGQQVFAKNINATTAQIDMSGFANGAYFIKVSSDKVTKTVKVIKK